MADVQRSKNWLFISFPVRRRLWVKNQILHLTSSWSFSTQLSDRNVSGHEAIRANTRLVHGENSIIIHISVSIAET